MTIGFIYTGTTYATPDKSMSKQSAPRVLVANFGDGYEQRIADGINTLNETYSLSFATRLKSDIDDIVAFFDTKHGVVPFNFTIPDSNGSGSETTIKVVCDTYTQKYDYDNFYSATATFRRVYE